MGNSGSKGSSGVSAGSGGYGSVNTNGYTCTHPHSNTSGTGVCTKNDGSSSFNYICKNTRSSSPTICKLNPSKYNYSTYHGDREGRGGGGVKSGSDESKESGREYSSYTSSVKYSTTGLRKLHNDYLQSKFSTFDVGYGQIHSNAIIGTNHFSQGVPFVNEVVTTIRGEVSKGTLHHKLVINGYNRGLSDYDLWHLGTKLSGSSGTTTSGVTLNLCLFDLHQNNITHLGMNNFLHFFKWQNISEINFSCNLLNDNSCIQLGYALSAGDFPHLNIINLSSNKIGDTGAISLANAIHKGIAPKLNSLYIENNNLTCIGKESLVKMACQIQWQQNISVSVDYGIVFPNESTDLIGNNWFFLNKYYSGVDVGYGKIHNSPIIGGSFYYRGVPFINEVVDTIKEGVIKKDLHHKLVINGYNRELVDSDLYYLGLKLTGHTDPYTLAPTTNSAVTLNLQKFDLHQNHLTHAGVNNFVHFFQYQNINEVDFSSNNLGDAGCQRLNQAFKANSLSHLYNLNLANNQITDTGAKYLADSLQKGEMSKLKTLHLEGNKISSAGESYLAVAVNKAPNDTLGVIVEKHTSSAGVWNFIKKAFNYYAQEHYKKAQANDKAALVIYGQDDWAHCKKLVADTSRDMATGFVKYSSYKAVEKALKTPYKLLTVGGVFMFATKDSVQNVNVENLVSCAAAINKNFGIGVIYHPDTLDSSVGFIGNNEEFVDDF